MGAPQSLGTHAHEVHPSGKGLQALLSGPPTVSEGVCWQYWVL